MKVTNKLIMILEKGRKGLPILKSAQNELRLVMKVNKSWDNEDDDDEEEDKDAATIQEEAVEKEQKNEAERDKNRKAKVCKSRLVVGLEKGRKPLPVGTKRMYNGMWYVKTAEGWKYSAEGLGAASDMEEKKSTISEAIDSRIKKLQDLIEWNKQEIQIKENLIKEAKEGTWKPKDPSYTVYKLQEEVKQITASMKEKEELIQGFQKVQSAATPVVEKPLEESPPPQPPANRAAFDAAVYKLKRYVGKGWTSPKTGHELIHYEHRSVLGEKWSDYEGGYVTARISDWENPETSELSGRQIVHVYWIHDKDTGEIMPYGIQSAMKKLGITEEHLQRKGKTMLTEAQIEHKYRESRVEELEKRTADSIIEANGKYVNAGYKNLADSILVEKDGNFIRIPIEPRQVRDLRVPVADLELMEERGWKEHSRLVRKPDGTMEQKKPSIDVMTEEDYLASKGAPFDFGEAGLHKNPSQYSKKVWDKKVKQQTTKDVELARRRAELRKEYARLVEEGKIRPPTRREGLERTAAGHPDNPSVQAAKRILAAEEKKEQAEELTKENLEKVKQVRRQDLAKLTAELIEEGITEQAAKDIAMKEILSRKYFYKNGEVSFVLIENIKKSQEPLKLIMKAKPFPEGTVQTCSDWAVKKSLRIAPRIKEFPEGTIRVHGGRKMKKIAGGWIPVSEGKTELDGRLKPSKSKKPKKGETVEGSREILNALQQVVTKKGVYLDDIKGEMKKTYNTLTKLGLIKFEHKGVNEYKAVLTESGQKALDGAEAIRVKMKREKKSSTK